MQRNNLSLRGRRNRSTINQPRQRWQPLSQTNPTRNQPENGKENEHENEHQSVQDQVNTYFDQLIGMTYSESKSHCDQQIIPLIMKHIDQIDWNKVNPNALHQFLFDIRRIRNKGDIKVLMNQNDLDPIYQSILKSLVVSPENTAMLSRPKEWFNFTLLQEMLRAKRVTGETIKLMLHKHKVDITFIGGKSLDIGVENWNENAAFLITREFLNKKYKLEVKQRYNQKMYLFLQHCVHWNYDFNQLFSVKSTFDNRSAIDHLNLPQSRTLLDAPFNRRIKRICMDHHLIQ